MYNDGSDRRKRQVPLSVVYPCDPSWTGERHELFDHFSEVGRALVSILPAIPDALRPVFRMVLSHVNGPSSAFKDAPGDRKLRKGVILLHGITGPRWQYVSLAEELAEHGFVVVMPEHPFDTSCTVLPDGNVLYALGRPPMDGEFGIPYDVWKSHLREVFFTQKP